MSMYTEELSRIWGYDSFRGLQEEAIDTIFNKKEDVFFLAPTSLRKIYSISTTSYTITRADYCS